MYMATLIWISTSNLSLMHEIPMVNRDPVAKLSCIDSIHQQQKNDDALKVSGLIDKTPTQIVSGSLSFIYDVCYLLEHGEHTLSYTTPTKAVIMD